LTAKRERSRHDKDNGGEFKLLIMAGLPKQIKMSLCLFCGILSVALKAQYSSALVLWFYSANWSQTLISTQQLHFCECVCVCVCLSLSLSLFIQNTKNNNLCKSHKSKSKQPSSCGLIEMKQKQSLQQPFSLV